jgi:phosphoglycerate kinase
MLPTDLLVATETLKGPLCFKKSDQLASNDIGVSLGPVSTSTYIAEITRAKTIFFNAAMGFSQRPETLSPTKQLIEAIEKAHAYGVIGGGDSVAVAQSCPHKKGIRHLSTGGGATLTYLSGQELPGLTALLP